MILKSNKIVFSNSFVFSCLSLNKIQTRHILFAKRQTFTLFNVQICWEGKLQSVMLMHVIHRQTNAWVHSLAPRNANERRKSTHLRVIPWTLWTIKQCTVNNVNYINKFTIKSYINILWMRCKITVLVILFLIHLKKTCISIYVSYSCYQKINKCVG